MIKKFLELILASELNHKAREYVEGGFKMSRDKVFVEVGSFYVNDLEDEKNRLWLEIQLEVDQKVYRM